MREGGNGGEEREYQELVRNSGFVPSGGGSWGSSAVNCLLDSWDDLEWFLPGYHIPDGAVGILCTEYRCTPYELAIPSMPSAISEGIVHATLAQRSRLTRAGVGWAIFLRTEACFLARRQGSWIESRGLALPPGGGVCCTSCCMATMYCLGLTGAHCTSAQRRTIPEIGVW